MDIEGPHNFQQLPRRLLYSLTYLGAGCAPPVLHAYIHIADIVGVTALLCVVFLVAAGPPHELLVLGGVEPVVCVLVAPVVALALVSGPDLEPLGGLEVAGVVPHVHVTNNFNTDLKIYHSIISICSHCIS